MNQEDNIQEQPENESAKQARIIKKLGIYALVRTALSSERSQMAWMRTAVSLYTFGFSITTFFDYLEQQQKGVQVSEGPKQLGFTLICMGILSLVIAAIAHLKRIFRMRQLGLPTISLFYLPIGVTVILIVMGITVLFGIGMNWSLKL